MQEMHIQIAYINPGYCLHLTFRQGALDLSTCTGLALMAMAGECGLQADALDRSSLASINTYSPGLSSAWMLQRAMSVRTSGRRPASDFINKLLAENFAAMQSRGDSVLKPFLQVCVTACMECKREVKCNRLRLHMFFCVMRTACWFCRVKTAI